MKIFKLIFVMPLIFLPISTFGTGRTGRSEREASDGTTTEKPTPSLFQTKTSTVKDHLNENQNTEQDVFQHLEKHIKSLRQMSHPGRDSKHEITDVINLFACLEPNSPYSGCDKMHSFGISLDNTFSCHEKNLKINIRFINKLCENGVEKVLYNKTVDVFLTFDNLIDNDQAVFEDKKCTFFRIFRGFSKEKAIIVFNNQFFVSHPNKIEEKLLLETWKESYTSWFLFKYKYFITDMSDGCVYFTTWTHYYAIRDLVITFVSATILAYLAYFLFCCTKFYSNDFRERSRIENDQPANTQTNYQLAQNQTVTRRGRPSNQN